MGREYPELLSGCEGWRQWLQKVVESLAGRSWSEVEQGDTGKVARGAPYDLHEQRRRNVLDDRKRPLRWVHALRERRHIQNHHHPLKMCGIYIQIF